MRRFAALLTLCAVQPALADPALLDFRGGQGCTIRLPQIVSPLTVTALEISAMISKPDEAEEPGCFLRDAPTAFDALNGGVFASGFGSYIRALGAEMSCDAGEFGANSSAFAARI